MKIYWYRNSKNLIGHRLHDLRISQHLTQRQLAARMQLAGMEMNEVTILRIEKGVRFVPDYEVAELAKALGVKPDAAAGHSLGEFSALVAAGALSFEDGLSLVSKRAMAMQKACEQNPSTMAAIIGLPDATVEEICSAIDGVVVPANYNCPGQLVISGSNEAIDAACAKLTEAGAKRALKLNVGGAFHSPLMEPARVELEAAIKAAPFAEPVCPVYQNVDAKPYTDPAKIQANLIAQLTSPVRWTQIVQNMIADGATQFTELGPGSVLQGLIRKVDPNTVVESKSTL